MTTEREWAQEQLRDVALSNDQKSAIQNLLYVYWTARDTRKLDTPDMKKVLELFGELAQGHAVVEENRPDEAWLQAKPGNVHMGETVRVRFDAYEEQDAVNHNGRVGVVVATRPDEVRVRYTDGKEPSPPYVRHRTAALEKRIR